MRRFIYAAILLLPFLLMISINEAVRSSAKRKYSRGGVETMNPNSRNPAACTWSCHDDSLYCKEHHVKHLRGYFRYTDPLYFGLIESLKSTGGYKSANIFLLVFLVPFLVWFLLSGSLDLQHRIGMLKKRGSDE